MWDAYAYLHSHFVDFIETNGTTGYYYVYPKSIQAKWMHQAEHSGKANAEKLWEPILKKLTSFPGITKGDFAIKEFTNYKAYFDDEFGSIDSGAQVPKRKEPWDQQNSRRLMARHGPGMDMTVPDATPIANLDSRLLGAEHFKHPNLTAHLKASAPFVLGGRQAILQGHLVGGGKVFKPDDDTAVNPAWRKAYVHLIGYKEEGKASVDSLRELAPDMGAYGNEVRLRGCRDWTALTDSRPLLSKTTGSKASGALTTPNSQ
jgi:hypothetical protein